MKKKILFLNCDAAWYGSEKILFYTVRTLSTRYDCHVILPYYGVLNKHLEAHGIQPKVIPYPIIRKKYFTPIGIIRYCVGCIYSTLRLAFYVNRNGIDIIYSNSITVLEGILIGVLLNKQHVWHHHHVIEKPRLIYVLLRQLVLFSKGFHLFVSQSLIIKYGLHKNQKYNLLYNGIEPIKLNSYMPESKRDHFVLGVLGTFNQQKGQIYLLHAVQFLLSHYSLNKTIRVCLQGPVYASDNRWLNEIKTCIHNYNLSNIVSIHAFKEDIISFYSGIDLFVLSSIIFDPFPTVVLEASSAGIPVIGFKSGGLEEMFDNKFKYLVDSQDVTALAQLILEYMYDSEKLTALAAHQNEIYQRSYTLDIFQKNLLKLL